MDKSEEKNVLKEEKLKRVNGGGVCGPNDSEIVDINNYTPGTMGGTSNFPSPTIVGTPPNGVILVGGAENEG